MNATPDSRCATPGSDRIVVRSLHSIAEFRDVIALEHQIWGYDDPEDAVGIPIFVITVKRGGILLGAFDDGQLIGFVYSLAGLKNGTPMQWSHMLGVKPEYRASGLGRRLKLEQRRVALAMGLDLMEWTYDPLQAVNAHLNFQRLGVVVEEYHQNVYGDSSSTLHRGNPTDRFIAQWWLRSPRVEALLERPAADGAGPAWSPGADIPLVLAAEHRGDAVEPARLALGREEPALQVAIPTGFTAMLEHQPGLAQAWRLATRDVFTHYLARGYRVVWFGFGPGAGEGRYLLQGPGGRREATGEERGRGITE